MSFFVLPPHTAHPWGNCLLSLSEKEKDDGNTAEYIYSNKAVHL